MSAKTKTKAEAAPLKAPRRTRKERQEAFERFAAEFGPKPGEKPEKRKRVGAVEFLIKLRRGEA
jgi:hypothetical protein